MTAIVAAKKKNFEFNNSNFHSKKINSNRNFLHEQECAAAETAGDPKEEDWSPNDDAAASVSAHLDAKI